MKFKPTDRAGGLVVELSRTETQLPTSSPADARNWHQVRRATAKQCNLMRRRERTRWHTAGAQSSFAWLC